MTHHPVSLCVKLATEPFELEQIYALNHKTFVEEIPRYPAAPNGLLVDRFDTENTYVIGLRHDRVIGMVAIRGTRPFSLDERLPGLDSYLPPGRSTCELRLLAIDRRDRRRRLLPLLLQAVWRHTRACGYDLAIISGIVQQQKLYSHLGFEPFGPLIGTPEARFQPMMLTLERFALRARALFRNIET
jgi:ribosomal protein S18 acetylase RimI-like enzyme